MTTEKPTLLEKWTEPTGGLGLDRRIEDMESEIAVPDPVSSGVSREGRVTVIPTGKKFLSPSTILILHIFHV